MTKQKTAVVTGARGMDASNLIKYLLELNYNVIGTDRRSSSPNYWRHDELGIKGKFTIESMDVTDFTNVSNIVDKYKPDEMYCLAAMSHVGESFKSPLSTFNINATGQTNILEAVRKFSPHTKIYFAATSELFGGVSDKPSTEETPFYPKSPYGVAKMAGFWSTKNYREAYGLYACSGILYNHEGALRSEEFVTRKITKNIAMWRAGKIKSFQLGNLSAKRDWGSSEDFVKGMVMMLQQPTPNDYILATAQTHSIRDFIQECFDYMHIEIYFHGKGENEKVRCKATNETIISVSKEFYRPNEVQTLLGSYSKAEKELGWKPTTTFKKLVVDMMKADLKREGVKIK